MYVQYIIARHDYQPQFHNHRLRPHILRNRTLLNPQAVLPRQKLLFSTIDCQYNRYTSPSLHSSTSFPPAHHPRLHDSHLRSRASKLTLLATSTFAIGTVVFVHFQQQAEKAVCLSFFLPVSSPLFPIFPSLHQLQTRTNLFDYRQCTPESCETWINNDSRRKDN